MIRGTIVWVNLEEATPPEFGKTRPAIVVSNSIQNEILDTLVIVPLSSQPPEMWPLRVKIRIHGQRDSFAVIPGIRQVSKKRLSKQIGQLSDSVMKEVDGAMTAYLYDA